MEGEEKITFEAYPMKSGVGSSSYTHNSELQREAADGAKAMLITSIVQNLDIDHEQQISNPSTTFKIADLGCSVGPNTFIAVNNIIEAISQTYQLKNNIMNLPEFQVFFNDHVSNDFNHLFQNLPHDRQYYASGVPGTFHGRLFPKASLNFVYSAFALQWLSKAPLRDLKSGLMCNKGRIYYHNGSTEVCEAYNVQYKKDMKGFLDARAKEMVPGGLMVLMISGRQDGKGPAESSTGPFFQPLEDAILELANEGKISHDQLDSFNIPVYSPSKEELQTLVDENGCFGMVRLDLMPKKPPRLLSVNECRAVFETIISKHFGHEIVDPLFDRYAEKIAGPLFLTSADDIVVGFFIILKRNYY